MKEFGVEYWEERDCWLYYINKDGQFRWGLTKTVDEAYKCLTWGRQLCFDGINVAAFFDYLYPNTRMDL